jgi:hypothetical protein
MKQEHRMANWLFEHLSVDVALAGDIIESGQTPTPIASSARSAAACTNLIRS